MTTDPRDRPADLRPDTDPLPDETPPIDRPPVDRPPVDRGPAGRDAVDRPLAAISSDAADPTPRPDRGAVWADPVGVDDVTQVGDALPDGASVVDPARRPDRVAVAMMIGVVVLLLICAAFGLAAS